IDPSRSPCQVSRAASLRRPRAPTIPSPATGAPGFLSPSGPPLRPESMEIRAPPTSLRLATPPSTASFRPVALRTSFLSGSVSLRAVQVRQSNVNRFKCNAIRSNLFDRLTRVVRSYANAILSSFEDPEKILDQAVLEMNDDLIKMRQATAQVLASQKRLENKYKAAEQADADWYRRAQLALQKGEEDLAREALKRRKSYAENASSLKAQLDQQKSVVENLVSNTRLLESKIAEAKQKKDTLKARAQSAKTATKVSEMLGNVNTSGALSAFEKMEEKVMTMESQAEALGQLGADDLEGKSLQCLRLHRLTMILHK
uniref:PspA/IM30 family protein n=1 Tax=Aegilops tauschii subsp. strangulata TaxID=200361 RepID=A0A453G7F7_AEGTS